MKSNKYFLTVGLFAALIFTILFSASVCSAQTAAAPIVAADNEYQVGGILFMQKAAEYRALCYQAFNLARMSLDADEKNRRKLPKTERKKPRAVVVDIDETMLDNSPAQADSIKNRSPFNLKEWYAWGEMRKAKAIPGAVEFANYAAAQNVKIFTFPTATKCRNRRRLTI